MMAEMEVLKANFEKLRLDINSYVKGMLDKRGVGEMNSIPALPSML